MKVVKGFQSAKRFLAREVPGYGEYIPFFGRGVGRSQVISEMRVVSEILSVVRAKGDSALFEYTRRLDGIEIGSLEVNKAEISDAYKVVDKELISALQYAAQRVREFQSICRKKLADSFLRDGLGRLVSPLDRVGIYIPGGTASYPSTVLMTAIPARVAGVREIIMTTPPNRNGSVNPATLVAADIAGVDRIFRIGGAQAIAALAFGTESVPKVDKICGPGNIFVVLAKKMVFGAVAVESLAGPSEVVIVADESANAELCAADLIAQAEHDTQAFVALITTSLKLAKTVVAEVKRQLQGLQREPIIRRSIAKGVIAVVNNMDEAIELVNLCAPEHVSLMVNGATDYISRIRNAGCIFVGDTPVVLGDYVAGPSHVLPTGGSARFSSPLSVEDFLKTTSVIALEREVWKQLGEVAMVIAEAEGLAGHARAMRIRMK